MMNRLLNIIIFLLIFQMAVLANKQYSFLQVNNTIGLVNNQVTCIYKDSRGFIWIGTAAGLSRYDGSSFVNYKHDSTDSTSIVDNYIVKIQEDLKGNLWIETRSNIVVFDIKKERFYQSIESYLKIPSGELNIENVASDEANNIWIKQYNHYYYQKYDSVSHTLKDVFKHQRNNSYKVVSFINANNQYYCLFSNGLLECYDGDNYQLNFSNDFLADKMGVDSLNVDIYVDSENDVWFYGNNEGIYHYQAKDEHWNHYNVNSEKIRLTSNIIKEIIQDDKGLIWVGTDHGGIDIINKFSGEVKKLYHQPDNNKSLAQNSITALYRDNNNIIWIGTYKKGVSYYHESIHKFEHYKHWLSDPNSLPYSDVNCFTEDKKGNLWIGTNGGGLIYFDRKNNKYTSYLYDKNNPYSLSNNVVVSLFIDGNNQLWVGTFTGGLNRFDGKRFHRYQMDSAEGLTSNNIWTINEDDSHRLWIGTLGGGIITYNRKKDAFEKLLNKGNINLPTAFISQIFKLSDGNMCIATANGVAFYNVKEQRYKYHPTNNRNQPYPISSKAINAVFEDSRGLLWIATREGLILLDPESNYLKNFTEEDGLPEDIINCIQEDEFQAIWISKSTGLSQIVVSKNTHGGDYDFTVYDFTEEDGLQEKEFNPIASYKTSNNELIFGGPNGFNLFEPKNIKYNKVLPKVVFTDFQVYNQSISPDSELKNTRLLDKTISSTDHIEIRYSMNVFTIDFTALDFFIPNKIRYKFKLEGFNNDWVLLNDKHHSVTYTNLNAGDYKFKVKASNNDGIWNEDYATLKIKVLPPFYATPWAYIIYFVIVLLVIIYLRYSMLKRERLKFAIEQDMLQTKRNREMDEMKLRFLTNVSHEFRTPLTLILTPLDKLLKRVQTIEDKKLLEVIDRNAKQLLELVNQLLDFRKLELHGMRYNPSYGNIVFFLYDVIENFREAYDKKNIKLEFSHATDQFMFKYDKEKLQKVLMNLLSNALKFTPEGGNVSVMLEITDDEERVNIVVRDSGIGIKKEDMDKIFVRFFQSEDNKKLGLSGSGIGLNLAREMVQLHNGTINVESDEGKGATFTVSLPVEKAPIEEVIESSAQQSVSEVEEDIHTDIEENGHSSILLVEDNVDFRFFMKETLHDMFTVYEAPDGKVGYEMVHKHVPDLIISDVMMPNMDGLELCQMLRKDIRTSHIPIILLTARTADEDKIKGLENGADDYITKPFNMDLLLLRIDKLLKKRSKMQKQFQKTVDISPSEVQITSMDEKLIKKAVSVVEKNISESSFSVEDLSKELGMSRVYLYKKLMSITGKSPIEFIRIIRLKRGAQLLEKSQMNIAEVAYEVGFNSPRYFSKYFKEEYGMLPTAYIKAKKKELMG